MPYTAEDILQVTSKYPTLDAFGFNNPMRVASPKEGMRPEAVQACAEWLLSFDGMDRRKTINRSRTSYTWKHMAERDKGMYVTNGEFICAALYLGYKMCKQRGGPNAYFNIKNPPEEE
jgi:hypothetical protein